MQQEYVAIPLGQFADGSNQRHPRDTARETIVRYPVFAPDLLGGIIPAGVRLVQRNLGQRFLPEMHQNRVNGDAVKPRRERRVSTKAGQLAKNLEERILSQVLGF